MERKLQISAFRNIGFDNESPSQEGLVLNHSLEKGKMGDLVILIGANNSGKSNVLDALKDYGDIRIRDKDVTDLFLDEKCRKPSIKLVGKDGDNQYSFCINYDGSTFVSYPKNDNEQVQLPEIDKSFFILENIIKEGNTVCNIEANNISRNNWIFHQIFSNINSLVADERSLSIFLEDYKKAIFYACDNREKYYPIIPFLSEKYTPIFLKLSNEYERYLNQKKVKQDLNTLNEKYNSVYGYNFNPTVYEYKQNNIGNSDLQSDYNNISNFLKSVLKSINFDPNKLQNAHEDFLRQTNIGILKRTEKDLNRLLSSVAADFNRLYYADDAKYVFEFSLESEKIFLSLYRGEVPISLNYQSTGFRWFFDLYFNLLASSSLNPGDIIIMDEPATNLHVKGQIELRKFLKTFAMKNDISIVIATHSPFLIDLDYLDELRIVSNKNSISTIDNGFTTINLDDPDSLLPIKESLTVENHVLVDPYQNVVFVEGITDYNYLVAMKTILGINNISFLPIKGIGKNKDQQLEISKKLIKIRKNNPILLVDSDGAGKAMEKINKDSELKVVSLSSISDKFVEIEDLFSPEDIIKFGIKDEKGESIKHVSSSSVIKNIIIANPKTVSTKTKENFSNLLNILLQ